jgi:hypothetical protein
VIDTTRPQGAPGPDHHRSGPFHLRHGFPQVHKFTNEVHSQHPVKTAGGVFVLGVTLISFLGDLWRYLVR